MHNHNPRSSNRLKAFLSFLFTPIKTFKCAYSGIDLCCNCLVELIVPYEIKSTWVKLTYVVPAAVWGVFIAIASSSFWGILPYIAVAFLIHHHLLASVILAFFPWTEFRKEKDKYDYIMGEFKQDFIEKLVWFGVTWLVVYRIARPFFA